MAPVVVPGLPSPIAALPAPLPFRSPFLPSHEHRNFFLRQQILSAPSFSTRPLDSSPKTVNGAYATFISKDDYLPGVLVLAYCHQMVKSKYPFIILATAGLSPHARAIIRQTAITLVDIEIMLVDIEGLVPAREQYDPSVTDARFGDTWTKLR